ncbi:hypothetical protein Syun_018268 [Stephania yunnanensis]|uniref:Phytocyanin domain-containing protein n=1 Tax=Stephania yunnanensis TaxID=152371 RepID=A0AAP0IRZ9_9MAGN
MAPPPPPPLLLVLITAAAAATASAYTNHTVGDAAGWFYNNSTSSPATSYPKWAASQSFSLGDFLIFNTTTDQTVIQTYNETTYNACSADDAADTDTFIYGGGDPAEAAPTDLAVPLTVARTNYFFSNAESGERCRQGMAFKITVEKGQGLPPSLNRPPPPPYEAPASPSVGLGGGPNGTGQQERFFHANGGADANVRVRCSGGPLLALFAVLALFLL